MVLASGAGRGDPNRRSGEEGGFHTISQTCSHREEKSQLVRDGPPGQVGLPQVRTPKCYWQVPLHGRVWGVLRGRALVAPVAPVPLHLQSALDLTYQSGKHLDALSCSPAARWQSRVWGYTWGLRQDRAPVPSRHGRPLHMTLHLACLVPLASSHTGTQNCLGLGAGRSQDSVAPRPLPCFPDT